MSWRSVIISQHGKVSYSSRQLVVQTRDGTSQIPIDDIQVLLLASNNVVITTAAINKLIQAGAKIIFTNDKGEPSCETIGYYPNNRDVGLLMDQFNWKNELKKSLWTKIVITKINMQIQVCKLTGNVFTELNNELEKIEVGDASNREAVVARKYFNLLFDKDFTRHEFDPINAALNYGYSILLSAVNREIVVNGYLTQFGIHHHSEENDFNLGSDLMEPFRPVIDYWVVNQKIQALTPDIKFALVDLLNFEMKYNGETTILRNALTKHVMNCLNYLSGNSEQVDVKVEIFDEVPNNAINGHV